MPYQNPTLDEPNKSDSKQNRHGRIFSEQNTYQSGLAVSNSYPVPMQKSEANRKCRPETVSISCLFAIVWDPFFPDFGKFSLVLALLLHIAMSEQKTESHTILPDRNRQANSKAYGDLSTNKKYDTGGNGMESKSHFFGQTNIRVRHFFGLAAVVLLFTAGSMSTALAQEQYGRGIWFWKGYKHDWGAVAVVGDLAKEDIVIRDFATHRIKRVYGSYGNRSVTEPDVIAAWNAKLFDNGIESQALYSNVVRSGADSVLVSDDKKRKFVDSLQDRVINFNNGRPDAREHFSAIHLDIEPQTLADEWDNEDTQQRKRLLFNLRDLLAEIRAMLDDPDTGDSNIKLYADIGHYFDRYPGGRVDWNDEEERNSWFRDISQSLDNITIMAYGPYYGDIITCVEGRTELERRFFPHAEIGVNAKKIGTTWEHTGDFIATLCRIENEIGNNAAIHSYRHFKDAGEKFPGPIETIPVERVRTIIDNGSPETSYTGDWLPSSGADSQGADSLYSFDGAGTYTFSASLTGCYDISMWWTHYDTRCTEVEVGVYDNGVLKDFVVIDQRADGSQWHYLGTYDFSDSPEIVINATEAECSTCADAVMFDPSESCVSQ